MNTPKNLYRRVQRDSQFGVLNYNNDQLNITHVKRAVLYAFTLKFASW